MPVVVSIALPHTDMEFLQYEFVQRALLAGILTAAVAPVIGVYLVTQRYAFMADTLAHVALAGAVIGAVLGAAPLPAAAVAAVLAGLAIEELRLRNIALGDAGLMLFLSGGLALAAALLTKFPHAGITMSGALFGSLTTVTAGEVWMIAVGAIIVAGLLFVVHRALFLASLDASLAAASGVPVAMVSRMFAAVAALTVALGTRTVGALLIGALIVLPPLAATQWGGGFRATMLFASALGMLSVLSGLWIAFIVGIPTGAAVVLCALALTGISMLLRR